MKQIVIMGITSRVKSKIAILSKSNKLQPDVKEAHIFKSGLTAQIDKDKCIRCGRCIEHCRFNAITNQCVVDPIACEGCGFCAIVCPANAITMNENIAGEWYRSETRFGPMVHARLGIAEENSGKLVSLVRQKAKEVAEGKNADWVIVDGAPGIGCPVIASLSGIDCAIVVTEPTVSGVHDMDRVIQVAKHFNVPVLLIINKYDLNEEVAQTIEHYCSENNIGLLGKVKFDKTMVEAVTAGQTIIEYAQNETTDTIKFIWKTLQEKILKD